MKLFYKLSFSWNSSCPFALHVTFRSRAWLLSFHVRKKGKIRSTISILTYFMPLVFFYMPRDHQKTVGFLMFLGGIEREQLIETFVLWSFLQDKAEKKLRWSFSYKGKIQILIEINTVNYWCNHFLISIVTKNLRISALYPRTLQVFGARQKF